MARQRGSLIAMASRSKATTGTQRQRPDPGGRDGRPEARTGRAGTREAIRDIVRRYRETFERLGR
jgi:hypothetical protein